jgi:hypothetical protein
MIAPEQLAITSIQSIERASIINQKEQGRITISILYNASSSWRLIAPEMVTIALMPGIELTIVPHRIENAIERNWIGDVSRSVLEHIAVAGSEHVHRSRRVR